MKSKRQKSGARPLMAAIAISLCLLAPILFLRNRGPANGNNAVPGNEPVPQVSNASAPAAVAPTNSPQFEAKEDKVVALANEGNQLLEQGRYAEAVGKFEQALALTPEDEDLHYNLGIALTRLGKPEEAKKNYLEALRIFPDYAEAHNNLGNLLMNENKLPEALEHFQEAVRLSPESASFHNNLGTLLGRQGRPVDAKAHFSEAVKLNPAYAEAHANLGSACLAAGEFDDAVRHLEEALKLKPNLQPAIPALERARQKQAAASASKGQ